MKEHLVFALVRPLGCENPRSFVSLAPLRRGPSNRSRTPARRGESPQAHWAARQPEQQAAWWPERSRSAKKKRSL